MAIRERMEPLQAINNPEKQPLHKRAGVRIAAAVALFGSMVGFAGAADAEPIEPSAEVSASAFGAPDIVDFDPSYFYRGEVVASIAMKSGVEATGIAVSHPDPAGERSAVLLADNGALSYLGRGIPKFVDVLPIAPGDKATDVFLTNDDKGMWVVTEKGKVFAHGNAKYFGDTSSLNLNGNIVAFTPTRSNQGYTLVAEDGGVFTYGDAKFFGSTGGMRLNEPVQAMAMAPNDQGYWLFAADGGAFAFGDAPFYNSIPGVLPPGQRLNKPIVGGIGSPSGTGYLLVASDGGIFAFGDSPFYGSKGNMPAVNETVAVRMNPENNGYTMLDSAGNMSAFGQSGIRSVAEGSVTAEVTNYLQCVRFVAPINGHVAEGINRYTFFDVSNFGEFNKLNLKITDYITLDQQQKDGYAPIYITEMQDPLRKVGGFVSAYTITAKIASNPYVNLQLYDESKLVLWEGNIPVVNTCGAPREIVPKQPVAFV